MIGHLVRRRQAAADRGQSMVEMALILPLLVLIVIGTLEFGFVFDHHLTLEYATREGARAGAALAHGGDGPPTCDSASDVDPLIIAAVQRVLRSAGSPVRDRLEHVTEIRIYSSGPDGEEGSTNIWRYNPVSFSVGGADINFRLAAPEEWPACGRNNTRLEGGPESVGVAIDYTYAWQTPISFLFGDAGLEMTDRTVMQLNPTP